MSHICDTCGSLLSSQKSLKIHKETAKKCLRMKENTALIVVKPNVKEGNRIDCRLCMANIVKSTYKCHLLKHCRNFDEKKHIYENGIVSEIDNLLVENNRLKNAIVVQEENATKSREKLLEEQINRLNLEIVKQNIEIKILKETIIKKDEELDRRTRVLEKKAFESKSVNNNYGIIQHYLSKPIDLEGECEEIWRRSRKGCGDIRFARGHSARNDR